MRERIIDLTKDHREYPTGYEGENEFRTLEIIPPCDMREVDFYIARFGINGENVPSETLTLTDGKLTLPIWKQLTQSKEVTMTLEGYIDERIIGKSHMVTLGFLESVGGAETPAEEADPTLAAQVNALTKKAFTAVEPTAEGLAFDNIHGECIATVAIQGGGGTNDHRLLTNRDAANQHPANSISGLNAAIQTILENTIIDGGTFDG